MILVFLPLVVWSQDIHLKDQELPCLQRKFSLHFHIVLDSFGHNKVDNGTLLKMEDDANKAFNPICFSFHKCETTLIKDYSFERMGSVKKINLMTNRFQVENVINVYIVDKVGFDLSYSIFEGAQDSKKGVIVVPRRGEGFVHEIGNLFGLLHTFETLHGVEKVDESNCKTTGDLICDTPADPYIFGNSGIKYLNDYCEFSYNGKDANGDYYLTEVGNFMSHYTCARSFFSKEQYIKMIDIYKKSPFKMY